MVIACLTLFLFQRSSPQYVVWSTHRAAIASLAGDPDTAMWLLRPLDARVGRQAGITLREIRDALKRSESYGLTNVCDMKLVAVSYRPEPSHRGSVFRAYTAGVTLRAQFVEASGKVFATATFLFIYRRRSDEQWSLTHSKLSDCSLP